MVFTKDSYRVLGVAPTCPAADIHAAYRRLSKEWHPDVNPERADLAHEKMQELVSAYNLVKSPQSRKDYDDQPHYRYRRTGKKPRTRAPVAGPSLLTRLAGIFKARKHSSNGPPDKIMASQQHYAMGLSMIESVGFLGEARHEFELSVELDPGYVDAQFNAGICSYRLGEYDRCIKALQKVLELNRDDRQALQLIQLLRDRDY